MTQIRSRPQRAAVRHRISYIYSCSPRHLTTTYLLYTHYPNQHQTKHYKMSDMGRESFGDSESSSFPLRSTPAPLTGK